MNLSRYLRLLFSGLTLCLGLGVFSTTAFGNTQIDIPAYIPAASAGSGYVSYLRVINAGNLPTPVFVSLIDGTTGVVGRSGQLMASLPAQGASTFTAQQVEAALGITLLASDRPRIRVIADTLIEAQSFLFQPAGVFSEISDALGGASSIIVRNYVPAAMASSGYVSYLRVVNTGTAATPVAVARVDPTTGQTGASGILNASIPAGAAITYSAAQIEAALGSPIAASERSRIKVAGAASQLAVQTFLLQPNGTFSNHSSGQTGNTIDVHNYVPAGMHGYTHYIRVINDGSVAAPVTVALIDDVTGVVGSPAVLISSLPAAAALTLTSSQLEAALGGNISAAARPQIRISSSVMLAVQSFLLQPGGAFNEISNASSGTSIDVRTYVPAADAGSGYTSYLRVINSGVVATPVTIALVDGVTGVVGSPGTLISSLPPGGATTLNSSQVEAALGIPIPSGIRPRIRITGSTILNVQSFLTQPGGAFAEVSGGQTSITMPVAGLMGGAIQGNALGSIPNLTTLAGSSAAGAVDGTGVAASFSSPFGITTDGTNLYVADFSNNKIRKIVLATGAVSTFSGSGAVGSVEGAGTAASFNMPFGITTDGVNLYVADGGNNKVRQIVIATGAVTTLAGAGTAGSLNGIGAAASFNRPFGITTDNINIYVADTSNNKVRQVVIATGAVTTLAGSGASGSANGIGAAATFNTPYGITTDGTNLYVADTYNYKIRKIVIATGAVTTLAGSGAVGAADGTGTAALFNAPYGITSDGANLYVADYSNSKIRKIVIATSAVSTLSFLSSNTIFQPIGITTDGISLYVTENNTIRKIMPPPTVTGMSPSAGEAGATITIVGANFDITPANNTVKFNGTPATVTAATATSITAIVPSGATSGTVSVTTAGGTAASAGRFTLGVPVLSINPVSLTFASQNIGTSSAARIVTLSNTGNGVLNISGIVVSGEYAKTSTCGATLAAGANCTISVTFTPTASGARIGTMTITSNAATSPSTVSLNGTGVVALRLFTINAACFVNLQCNAQLVANVTGGLTPYHFQQDSFAYGLRPLNTNIDLSTGNIVGVPSQTGTYTFNLCVVDIGGTQNCQPVTVTVTTVPTRISVNPASLTMRAPICMNAPCKLSATVTVTSPTPWTTSQGCYDPVAQFSRDISVCPGSGGAGQTVVVLSTMVYGESTPLYYTYLLTRYRYVRFLGFTITGVYTSAYDLDVVVELPYCC